jgi:carboxypeptidase D
MVTTTTSADHHSENMTWNGKLGFQEEPTKLIDIQLPALQYQPVFEASGLGGSDGPGPTHAASVPTTQLLSAFAVAAWSY